MSSEPSSSSPTVTSTGSRAPSELAEELLGAISAVRRSARRQGLRPPVFSTLTGSQLELVRLIRRNPEISVTRAAEALKLAPNTVSTLVGELASRGLLVRRPDPGDHRVARLELTPEFRRQAESWRDQRVATISAGIERLTGPQLAALERAVPVLGRLADCLGRAGEG